MIILSPFFPIDITFDMKLLPFLIFKYLYSCAPDWKAVDTFGRFYNWYLLTCGFFVPTTIVLVANVIIMNVSRRVSES